MSRKVRRVQHDFDWPLEQVWKGYLMPERLHEDPCEACGGRGYSPRARHLMDLWYGYAAFRPEDNGSEALTPFTPAVRELAERHVNSAPGFYGTGDGAVDREALRLCDLWNGMWIHHLNAADVAALVQAGRLMDLTHRWIKGEGWQPLDPPVVPTPEAVNDWSVRGFGHDSINAAIVVKARCARESVADTCSACDGHGSMESYPGQRADAEAWEPTDPPAGEGWQLWETVSEGSPCSPVFPTAEALAQWLTTEAGGRKAGPSQRPMTLEQARGFVAAGWAPTGILNAGGYHDGAAYVGAEAVLRDHEL